MKIDFTSLQTETVQYFILHSGVFVAGLGLVFFLLGLTFGWLTWRRYRQRWLGAMEGEKALRSEVSDLQKLLAEQESPKPAEAPLTEKPVEEMEPSKKRESPVLAEMPDYQLPKVAGGMVAGAGAASISPKFEIPSIPDLPAFGRDPSFLNEPEEAESPHGVDSASDSREVPSPLESSLANTDEEAEVQPFSFLLSDDLEELTAKLPDENAGSEAEIEPFSFLIEPEEEVKPEDVVDSDEKPNAAGP